MPTFRLVDCDGDTRSANNENDFTDLAHCIREIKEGLKEGQEGVSYLPWKLVDYDSAEDVEEMTVLGIITDIEFNIVTEVDGRVWSNHKGEHHPDQSQETNNFCIDLRPDPAAKRERRIK